MKKDIKELLEVDKFYLSKEVFNLDLTVPELRLLIILSSSKVVLNELDSSVKHFIDPKNYNKINDYVDKLIGLGLVGEDGLGKTLDKDFIIFDIFPNFKSVRQLFMMSLSRWHKNSLIIISTEVFYNLFTNTPKRINQYWKQSNKQANVDYSYTISKNIVKITNNNKNQESEDIKTYKNILKAVKEDKPKPKVEIVEVDKPIDTVEDDFDFDKFEEMLNSQKNKHNNFLKVCNETEDNLGL